MSLPSHAASNGREREHEMLQIGTSRPIYTTTIVRNASAMRVGVSAPGVTKTFG